MSNYPTPSQAGGMAAYLSMEIPPLKGPTQEDWERHRPLIKQLYVDERMTLKEVMNNLLLHGHKASLRTYKNWINRWGFDKKNKERDMIAISRKKTQRDAIGKKSSFRVRGQTITMEQVEYYFKRKKKAVDDVMIDAPTPSDVSCWTPSPPTTPQPLENINENFPTLPPSNNFTDAQPITRGNSSISPNMNRGLSGFITGEGKLSPFRINNETLQLTAQDVYNILSENPRVSRSPLPSQVLLLQERLFFNLKQHFNGSFESGMWTLDADGWLENTKDRSEEYPEYSFFQYCLLAGRLKDEGAFVASRRALSKMFNQVPSMLRLANPRALDTILEVFLHLANDGHTGILRLIRGYLYAMAKEVIAGDSPWGQICQILSILDEEYLVRVTVQSWKCMNDKFSEYLGPFNNVTLNVYMCFIQVCASEELFEAERLLRNLLDRCKRTLDAGSEQVIKIMNTLGYNLCRQEKYEEAEILLVDALSHAQKILSSVEEAEVRYHMAYCQINQDKKDLAEENMREAIKIAGQMWGTTDSNVIRNLRTLVGWLREWGRDKEADELEEEFEEALGLDEIDLEMAQTSNKESQQRANPESSI